MLMKAKIYVAPMLIAAALAGCSDSPQKENAGDKAAVKANIMTIKSTNVPDHYFSSGIVTSDHRIAISSRLSGYVREMAVREGEKVSKGQILVRIDPVDSAQSLNQASADLADAKADYLRYKELFAANAVSKQQYDKASLRYRIASSRATQANNQMSYAEIASPVDGIVVQKMLNAGDLTNPGSPILVVEDPDKLLIETSVSEQFIDLLHPGDAVDVSVPAVQGHLSGQIRQVVNAADPSTHQFLIKISIPTSDKVRPGMFAEIGFRIGNKPAIVVPTQAVVLRSGLTGLYLVDSQHIAHYRQVRTGNTTGAGIEIVAGLQNGDRVAWTSQQPISSGMTVEAK